MLRLARERVAQLAAAHEGLHSNTALWASAGIPADRTAAQELAQELQAAVKRQVAHVSQVAAAAKSSKDEVAAVTAQTVALDGPSAP